MELFLIPHDPYIHRGCFHKVYRCLFFLKRPCPKYPENKNSHRKFIKIKYSPLDFVMPLFMALYMPLSGSEQE